MPKYFLPFCLLIVAIIGICFNYSGSTTIDDVNSHLTLVSCKDDLHLGEVWAKSTLRQRVRLENPFHDPIVVEDIRTGCTCLSIDPHSFLLPSGKEQQVEVLYDLNVSAWKWSKEFPFTPLPSQAKQTITLPIRCGEEQWQERIILTADVKNPLAFDRIRVDSSSDCASLSDWRESLRYFSQLPLDRVAVTSSEELILASVTEIDSKVGKIDIQFGDEIEQFGRIAHNHVFETTVIVETHFSEGMGTLISKIPLTVRLNRLIDVFPEIVSLGPSQVGSVVTAWIQLNSKSVDLGEAISVDFIESRLSVERFPKEMRNAATFKVSKTIERIGTTSDSIDFSVDTPLGKRSLISVQVETMGIK